MHLLAAIDSQFLRLSISAPLYLSVELMTNPGGNVIHELDESNALQQKSSLTNLLYTGEYLILCSAL